MQHPSRRGAVAGVTVIVLLVALGAAGPAHADVTTGLVGYWPFSGNAQDASGNGNDGMPNAAAVLTADRDGHPDSAYHFDGLSARIDVPSSPSLASPTTGITIAAWIRRDGWSLVGDHYNPILTKSISSANAFQYRLVTTPAGIGTAFNNWDTSSDVAFDFVVNQWYHVCVAWAADTLRTYIDGALLAESDFPVTIVPDDQTLSIGSDTPGFLEIFYGDIDEVRIYNRALTAADVAELAGVPIAVPLQPVAWRGLELGRAYPNPTTLATAIPFVLPDTRPVSVQIFDVSGRRIRDLALDREYAAGPAMIPWDGRDASGRPVVSGLYLYRFTAAGESATGKVIVRR